MADNVQMQQSEQASPELKEKGSAGKSFEAAMASLAKFGGFAFLETAIDGIQNMNPERKCSSMMNKRKMNVENWLIK